jgi:hypothetical protein
VLEQDERRLLSRRLSRVRTGAIAARADDVVRQRGVPGCEIGRGAFFERNVGAQDRHWDRAGALMTGQADRRRAVDRSALEMGQFEAGRHLGEAWRGQMEKNGRECNRQIRA